MPKLRVIIKPPSEPQGEPEQQVEALRDYLLQMSEELAYVLTHLEADNINDSTFERIQGMIPRPYTGLPVMDGDAASGQSEQWARGDHRHGHDSTKADVTALEETAGDLADHVADIGNPHEVTAAQVGLGNVDNVRQYSASNPPPIPTPGEVGAIPTTEKGSAGGVAELDANGMVPSAQLPSYVDDVLEYASLSAFPVTGESGKIYVALDTGRTYRWGGSAYVEISESLALGETSATAYRGDRGKIAYDHSQTTGNPHGTTAAEVGARPDDWMPTAADVGARPDTWVPTKADVGLGNVENERQYSAQNPPPYPVTSVNGSTGAVSLDAADVGARSDNWVPDAEDVPYDNTQSGLMATDVQAAIDELAQGGGGGGTAASAVSYDNTDSGLAATNVQDALDEVFDDLSGKQNTITASGILKGDGAGGVSAATAGTDYQAPLTAGTDYATPGMIPTVPSAYTSNPEMDGTASPGSSGAWAKGDHVHPSDTSRVPVYGMGKNLLDNWYFLNPVNQRGQTALSANGYFIDRWVVGNNANYGTVSLVSDGLSMTHSQNTGYTQIGQVIENLSGKKCTLSGIVDSALRTCTFTFNSQGNALPFGRLNVYSVNNQLLLRCPASTSDVIIKALKLELGTESTFAHQENGVWVLNEIPDYSEELRKCRYYFTALDAGGSTPIVGIGVAISNTQATLLIPLPVGMRKVAPTVTFSGTIKLWHGSVFGSSAPNMTAFVNPAWAPAGISSTIQVASGLTAGQVCMLQLIENNPRIEISCDL